MSHLPDCMMPDGAEPCIGYTELRVENERLQAALHEARRLIQATGTQRALDRINELIAHGCPKE